MFEKGATFDAIITDVDMPEMNGYALAQTILADPRRTEIPIIALGAHAAPAVVQAAKAAGMRAAVGKFDRAALIKALAEVLDGRGFNQHAIENQVLAEVAA
jgi:two-component system chemotaxis sensor kinase CheA